MLKKSLLLIALTLGFSTDVLLTNLVAVAKPASNVSVTRTRNNNKTGRRGILGFKVPKVRPSGNREGGAARGACSPQDISAVLPPRPKNLEITKAPVDSTLSDHPTFFVNIPQSSAKQAEFLLKDENNEELLREDIDLGSSNGLVSYTLPKSFKGLEVGKKYIWRFSLLCNQDDRSANPRTSAWIQRVEPSPQVAQQLQAAIDDLERSAIYAEFGFWQETLKSLVDLRVANPNDQTIAESWNNVLKSVELASLAQKPVFQVTGVPSDL
ncbi:MAG TPA: DUF928 domain-containing protein [Nostocaceae cyanobacterium]|nr:DUF928 domain-containing protein [Nostocaceae cyanobacterium]